MAAWTNPIPWSILKKLDDVLVVREVCVPTIRNFHCLRELLMCGNFDVGRAVSVFFWVSVSDVFRPMPIQFGFNSPPPLLTFF